MIQSAWYGEQMLSISRKTYFSTGHEKILKVFPSSIIDDYIYFWPVYRIRNPCLVSDAE